MTGSNADPGFPLQSLYVQRHQHYVEANQDGVGRRSQGSVGFGIPPTPEPMIFTLTSSVDSFTRSRKLLPQNPVRLPSGRYSFVNFAFGHVGEHVLEFRFLLRASLTSRNLP